MQCSDRRVKIGNNKNYKKKEKIPQRTEAEREKKIKQQKKGRVSLNPFGKI